jgi:hypothetical protein
MIAVNLVCFLFLSVMGLQGAENSDHIPVFVTAVQNNTHLPFLFKIKDRELEIPSKRRLKGLEEIKLDADAGFYASCEIIFEEREPGFDSDHQIIKILKKTNLYLNVLYLPSERRYEVSLSLDGTLAPIVKNYLSFVDTIDKRGVGLCISAFIRGDYGSFERSEIFMKFCALNK